VRTRRGLRRWLAAAGLAAIALPALCATHTVTIEAMQFSPAVLTVKRGDQVVWANKDLVPHTATAAKAFDSGSLAPGQSWRMTTGKPGRYDYVCTLHPTMKAVLVVE
jgi:plastocyanin